MLKRYGEGCFYMGCLAPLGFSALALWIVADRARRVARHALARLISRLP
jgi:hypothetical protein